MQDGFNFGACFQPFRYFEGRCLMGVHPDGQSTQPSAGKICVVRRHNLTKLLRCLTEPCPIFFVGGHAAQHDVAVPDNIFGGGQNSHVHTLVERREKIRCRPCVIEKRYDAALLRLCADSRDILDLECQAARCFEQYCFRPLAVQALIIGDQWVEISGFDAEPLQESIGKGPAGIIGIVRHQQDIPGAKHRQQGAGNSGNTGGVKHRPCRARFHGG